MSAVLTRQVPLTLVFLIILLLDWQYLAAGILHDVRLLQGNAEGFVSARTQERDGLMSGTGSLLILTVASAHDLLWAGDLQLNRLLRRNSVMPRPLDLAGAVIVAGSGIILLTGSPLS